MKYIKRENGFTLLEVLAVIIIIGVLGAVAIPKLASSAANARRKADVATAHEVKSAMDRYQVENGVYLKTGELTVSNDGIVVNAKLIPKYISKLDKSTTQQVVSDGNKGFGVAALTADADNTQFIIPDIKTNTIMIYLSGNGLAAEVRAYDEGLNNVLWTSAN